MSTKLFYNKFVDNWMHALPLGNGRIGAMVFGNPDRDVIEINEESLWSGRQIKENNHATPEALAEIRRLISEERLQEASELSEKTFLSDPPRVRFYESFGEIFIDYADQAEYTDYRKELELKDAIVSVCWKKGETAYRSECFVSEEYDAFVYRVNADAPFSCSVTMKRRQDAYTAAIAQDTLLLNGRVTWFDEGYHGAGGEGISFGAMLKIETDGKIKASHDSLSVSDATYFVLYGAFSTNYNVQTFDIDKTIDYRASLRTCMSKLRGSSYEAVKQAHLHDHQKRFSAVELNLDAPDYADIPTIDRLQAVKNGEKDPDLCVLYYNFGRYLLIESSGKNAVLPANLQGIWSHGFRPAWGADYHTNINLQMNYWNAEVGNCSEVVSPLTHFVKMLSKFGKATAKELFFSDGWTLNHTTDIFGRTGIHDLVGCGFFPMAGPWMCLSLWEHYEFTDNLAYLKEIYPILRDSCRFVCDYLTEAADGTWMTSPSNSPENRFYYDHPDGTRKMSMLTQGATFDFEIIYALFIRVKYACSMLGEDPAFAKRLSDVLENLPPLRVSERYGTICEWIKDYEEKEPGHRHISHMFALYPSDQINETDPVIYEAAKNTIARRLSHGSGQTGWSRAWIINFYARLKDGSKALQSLYELLSANTEANLFDLHPPHIFQIDGNLGSSAGISEMLIQSHLGTPGNRIVELLPALPEEWRNGSVRGLKARGNFTFDFAWKDCRLTEAVVTAAETGILRMKLPEGRCVLGFEAADTVNGILECALKKGESVAFRFED